MLLRLRRAHPESLDHSPDSDDLRSILRQVIVAGVSPPVPAPLRIDRKALQSDPHSAVSSSFCVGHLGQRRQYLLLGIINVLERIVEKVVQRLSLFGH
jgi:hypothetical protein